MSTYITIDGGTTNTRAALVCDDLVLDMIKLPFGIKDGRDMLAGEIRKALDALRDRHGELYKSAECILASGMITSELGLCHVDHLTVPAGLSELHSGMVRAELHELSDLPFFFVPGIKTACSSLENADMMRGEETELMGIIGSGREKTLYVLPGSHTKLITVNEKAEITDFRTMLTGEILSALYNNTILKNAFDLSRAHLNEKYLKKGYVYCREYGFNSFCFKVRILNNLFSAGNDEIYSFFLGGVLCGDVSETLKTDAALITIGGKSQLRDALKILIEDEGKFRVRCLDDEEVGLSTICGAIGIYENRKLSLRVAR